jgi:hypothetical protein
VGVCEGVAVGKGDMVGNPEGSGCGVGDNEGVGGGVTAVVLVVNEFSLPYDVPALFDAAMR